MASAEAEGAMLASADGDSLSMGASLAMVASLLGADSDAASSPPPQAARPNIETAAIPRIERFLRLVIPMRISSIDMTRRVPAVWGIG
ncbi:hypothetical protein ASF21_10230 [Arthrobacter sp. Leaf234]|nr:hypothetical protein ASF21_10230 [Arthrobacter sp. Leaf234]